MIIFYNVSNLKKRNISVWIYLHAYMKEKENPVLPTTSLSPTYPLCLSKCTNLMSPSFSYV